MLNLADWLRTTLDFTSLIPRLLLKLLRVAARSHRNFEVERKFSISAKEHNSLPDKLLTLGFKRSGLVQMTDTFIPTTVEGDMCRVREEKEDARTIYLLTRKTWVMIEGQRERDEREEKITDLARETLLELGQRLQKGPLLSFSKERELFTRKDRAGKITVALDLVEGLGEYSGDYMEVEILIARQSDVASARDTIGHVAREILGEEREFVQLSYMEMLKSSMSAR